MKEDIQERLFLHADPFRTGRLGPSTDDIARIPLSEEILTDLKAALGSSEFKNNKLALFFCQGLLQKRPRSRELIDLVVAAVRDLIKSNDGHLRSYTVPVLIQLREDLPDYREQMLNLLCDAESSVRTAALLGSDTFLRDKEIEPLLPFRFDTVVSETDGMGGPWRYIFRDEALFRIERSLERTFGMHECSEAKDNQVIFWWDWVPFLEWWSKQKR